MIDDMNRYTKGVRERQAELDAKQVAEGMNEPTLTCSLNESNRTQFESCSEVVERLATECVLTCNGLGAFDRSHATAILHSWRERRVQELEEALRACMKVVWSEFHVGDGVCGEGAEPYAMGEKALANSEQARKGAKHE